MDQSRARREIGLKSADFGFFALVEEPFDPPGGRQ
jgi:hypothetical protein